MESTNTDVTERGRSRYQNAASMVCASEPGVTRRNCAVYSREQERLVATSITWQNDTRARRAVMIKATERVLRKKHGCRDAHSCGTTEGRKWREEIGLRTLPHPYTYRHALMILSWPQRCYLIVSNTTHDEYSAPNGCGQLRREQVENENCITTDKQPTARRVYTHSVWLPIWLCAHFHLHVFRIQSQHCAKVRKYTCYNVGQQGSIVTTQ